MNENNAKIIYKQIFVNNVLNKIKFLKLRNFFFNDKE